MQLLAFKRPLEWSQKTKFHISSPKQEKTKYLKVIYTPKIIARSLPVITLPITLTYADTHTLTQTHLAEINYMTPGERGFFSQKLSWALNEDHLPTLVLQSVKKDVPTNKPHSGYFWTAGLCCFWHQLHILANSWWHVRWRLKCNCSPAEHRALCSHVPKTASQRPEAASTL